MSEFNTYQWVTLAIPVALFVIPVLWAWLRQGQYNDATKIPRPFQTAQVLAIDDTAGTPAPQQFTQGMKLNHRAMKSAEILYDLGLEQYNHPVNNRDGIVSESRKITAALAPSLSLDELKLADEIGQAASAEHLGEVSHQQKISLILRPNTRTYAHHKSRECQALASIAKDLEKNVPRTDYTLLKRRIASGNTDLHSIIAELPIIWQSIQTLNEKTEEPAAERKPPKQEKVIAVYQMADGRTLVDKHAEIDGDWLTSHKYNFLTPCPPPAEILHFDGQGKVQETGTQIREIDREPSSEWLTKFWRQGGYMDQVYLRASAGILPHQLRRAYRRRQIRKVQWSLLAAGIVANIAIFIINNS